MNLNPQVIDTLRKMFADGATPSQLIRYLARYHSNDPNWPNYISTYFAKAFSIVLLEMEGRSIDDKLDDKTMAILNTQVLHELVGRAHLWKTDAHGQVWFDGLDISADELTLIDSVDPKAYPSLVESWPLMSEEGKEFVRRVMINSQSYYEKTQILARLVERLQHRIDELDCKHRLADQDTAS